MEDKMQTSPGDTTTASYVDISTTLISSALTFAALPVTTSHSQVQ
jgi:hypothetical protein